MKNPAIAAEINDTSVAPNNNFNPKRATISPFSLFRDLIAPEIIPIELKFANDTTNTEITPTAWSLISFAFLKLSIATNSFESNLVAMIEPA